jgi:hypothetical protein
MPLPAKAQPAIATQAGNPSTAVSPASTVAKSSWVMPSRLMRVLPSRSPMRPETSDALAHASAAAVRPSPAHVAEKPYRSISR